LPLVPCEERASPPCWHMMSAFTSCQGGIRLLSARSRPRLRFSLPEEPPPEIPPEDLEGGVEAKEGLRRRRAWAST